MSARCSRPFALAALLLGAALLGCGDPIVGAECLPGYTLCGGACVDLDSDPNHCGSCDNSCGALACNAGMCGPDRDAGEDGGIGLIDGGGGGTGGVRPPGQSSGSSGFPIRPDGGVMFPDPNVMSGCAIGETECGAHCADLQRDPDNCGACGAACGAGQFCISGMCANGCDPPLRRCGAQCVDFETDARNCGGCGIVCASGLCQDGECADVVPGHLIVIGHDYASVSNGSGAVVPTIQQVAGNALFLARGAPVRTLVYRGAAQSASIAGVNRAFNAVAAASSRDWEEIAVEPDDVSAQLIGVQAFVIHAQRGATDAELEELGQRWGLSVAQFLIRGGVVVVFDTMSSSNGGTYRLLEPAGLFDADARAPASGDLAIVAPGDSVATNTTLGYRNQPTTVCFEGLANGSGVVVVQDAAGEAVVVHRVAVP